MRLRYSDFTTFSDSSVCDDTNDDWTVRLQLCWACAEGLWRWLFCTVAETRSSEGAWEFLLGQFMPL
jgi:hypothetical protein